MTPKNPIRISFADFWRNFDKQNNFITRALARVCDYEIVDEAPDYLFYSCFGDEHRSYECIKIFYTGENDVPDFNECDYAISFHPIDFGTRHIRIPLYALCYDEAYTPVRDNIIVYPENAFERDFCSIVVSNNREAHPMRTRFMERLSDYKPVASGGRYANNVGGPVDDKMAFIARYKFNIAMENSDIEGYTTEKIIEPMAAATIPIYWGDKTVSKAINPEAFINLHDFDTIDAAIAYIKEVDNNKELYLKMLTADKLVRPATDWDDKLLHFLSHIITHGQRYVSPYGRMGVLNREACIKSRLFSCRLLRSTAKHLSLKNKKAKR